MDMGIRALILGALVTVAANQAQAFSFSSIFGESTDQKLMDACEATLKDRLKAPSTYKRIDEVTAPTRPATLDEYLGWEDSNTKADDMAEWATQPALKELHDQQVKIFKLSREFYVERLINYDADNSFGVPIRSIARCSWVTSDPKNFGSFDKMNVRINGFSDYEWNLHQLRALSGQ